MSDWKDAKWRSIQDRVQDFLDGLIAEGELGRRKCAHEDDWQNCEVEDCKYSDTTQSSPQMVNGFVLIPSYVSMTVDDEGDYGIITARRMPRSQIVGLMTVALQDY